jgi:cytochrome b involved in lipid metabolism
MKADCVHWLASRRIDLSKLSMKEQFFHLVKLYPYYLVERLSLPPCKEEEASRGAEIVEQKKEVVVIINDAVYSLSHQFVEAHPGGDSILKHYHCKNASKMFELACHSRSARNQATGFAVWSADLWVGRKGYLMILDPSVFPRREGSMSRPRSWTSELSAEFSKYEEDVMR